MIGNGMYVLGSLVATAIAYLLLAALRRPMRQVLSEICGTGDRAEFWHRLIVIEVTTVALVLAMLGGRPDEYASTSQLPSHVWFVLKQVRWGLTGFILALPIVGFGIAALIPSYESRKAASKDQDK